MIVRNVCMIIGGIAALVLIGALAYTMAPIFITPEAEIEPDAPPDAPIMSRVLYENQSKPQCILNLNVTTKPHADWCVNNQFGIINPTSPTGRTHEMLLDSEGTLNYNLSSDGDRNFCLYLTFGSDSSGNGIDNPVICCMDDPENPCNGAIEFQYMYPYRHNLGFSIPPIPTRDRCIAIGGDDNYIPSNHYVQNEIYFLVKESKCSSNGSFYLFQWSCNTSPPHSNYYGGYYTLSECLGKDFNISNVSNKVKIGYRR